MKRLLQQFERVLTDEQRVRLHRLRSNVGQLAGMLGVTLDAASGEHVLPMLLRAGAHLAAMVPGLLARLLTDPLSTRAWFDRVEALADAALAAFEAWEPTPEQVETVLEGVSAAIVTTMSARRRDERNVTVEAERVLDAVEGAVLNWIDSLAPAERR